MTTKIILSNDKKYYDVWYSVDGLNYKLHREVLKVLTRH